MTRVFVEGSHIQGGRTLPVLQYCGTFARHAKLHALQGRGTKGVPWLLGKLSRPFAAPEGRPRDAETGERGVSLISGTHRTMLE